MQALRVETTISKNGELQVKGLPFRPGEKVEVIVLPLHRRMTVAKTLDLKNSVLQYKDPTNPVAEQDWEALPHVKLV